MEVINRKTYKVDATGKVLGRLATDVASHLIGKDKASFQSNIDNGDIVEVENVAKMKITGKKMVQKKYFTHTNYPGGLKTKSLEVMFKNDPAKVLKLSVSRMLPKNKHRVARLGRLKIS
jgi:large subunit ribosomal protein L13